MACIDELAPRHVIVDPFDVERLAWNIQRAEPIAPAISRSALASFEVACFDLMVRLSACLSEQPAASATGCRRIPNARLSLSARHQRAGEAVRAAATAP